jgi:hypothetical protein
MHLIRTGLGLLGIALLAAFGIAGCGGSGDDTTAELPLLTKKRFVEKTNDVCFKNSQDQAKKVEAFKRKHGITAEVPSLKAQETYIVQVILPIVRRTIGELEEMGEEIRAPQREEAWLEEFVAALDKSTTISEKTPRWLAEPSKNYEPFMPARELAAKMGTYLCGQA